jgi:hypothetical protein
MYFGVLTVNHPHASIRGIAGDINFAVAAVLEFLDEQAVVLGHLDGS